MSQDTANFLFFIGLVILALCAGIKFGPIIGFSVLGGGLMAMGMLSSLIRYLEKRS